MNSFNFSWLTFVTDEQVQQWQLTYLSVPLSILEFSPGSFFPDVLQQQERNTVCVREVNLWSRQGAAAEGVACVVSLLSLF